jgi:site-specific DNA-methyltransferase (adenine-specific)
MLELRKSSIRSHLGAALSKQADAIPIVEELIGLMDRESYAWRMRVPALIRGYFHDMQEVIRASRRLLRPGGKCHIVVGNSAYGGMIVPTDALLAHLGIESGFSSAKITPVRHLTVAPQQRTALRGLENFMRESVVTLW